MEDTRTLSNDEQYQAFLSNIDPDVAARELAHIAVLRGEMRDKETDWARAKAFADGKKDEFHAARSRFELAFDEMLALSTGESKTPLLDRAEQGETAVPAAAGNAALEALSDDLAKIGYPTDLSKLEAMSESEIAEVRAFCANIVSFRSTSTDPSHSDSNPPELPAALRGPEEVDAEEVDQVGDGAPAAPEGETPRQRKRREKREAKAKGDASATPEDEDAQESHVH